MKHIFVGLIASLAFVALTQAAATCPLPKVCAKRADGYCQIFRHTCHLDNVNCMLDNEISRKWTQVDASECSKVTDTIKIAICTSSCPAPTDCKSTPTDIVCGANTSGGKCTMYANLCDLKAESCKNPDLFPAVKRRCVGNGIQTAGQTGKCAAK